jgi:small nuclear ribonucleoprotein (snRNP)-like protein
MANHPQPRFDDYLVRQARSTDADSPISYVRQFLGRRLGVHLVDGTRQVIGKFVALDSAGQMTMTDAMEVEAKGRHRELGTVIIGLIWIHKLEERPE